MTISTQASAITVAGTGSAFTFDFNFVGESASVITVSYIDAAGNQTTLSPSQYTLILNAPDVNQLWGIGGTVTYPLVGSPIALGTSLLIARTLPLTQIVSIQNQGNFYPTVTEQALDVLEMQIQQVSARTGQTRGTWAAGIFYNYGDVVVDGANGDNTGNYYMCAISNTSSVWSTELAAGDWSIVLNLQPIAALASSAASSASSASASATTATTQATSATNSAATATTQAGIATAAASSAQNYAAALNSTSTTPVTIGLGSQAFTTQSSKQYASGEFLTIVSAADVTNYMFGQISSYSGTSLVVNIVAIGGSGTHTDWNISIAGAQGVQGPPGTGNIATGTAGQLSYYATTGNGVSGNINTSITNGGLILGASAHAGSGVQGSLTLSGSTSGSSQIIPAASALAILTLPNGFDTLIAKNTVDVFTNKTYDTAATGNVLKINGTQVTSISGNTSKLTTATGSLTSGNLASFDASGNIKDSGLKSTPNTYQATPANPTGTTNATGVMMGLSGSITPANTGNIMIVISGDAQDSAGNNGTVKIQIRYGTGSAPSNGAALTGSTAGGQPNYLPAGGGSPTPFALNAIVTGLTLGTTYWIDISLSVGSGDTAAVKNISISAFEIK